MKSFLHPVKNRLIIKEKLIIFSPSALLLTMNIFLFAPATVYKGNLNEFSFGFIDLLLIYIIPFFVVNLLLLLIGLIIPRKKTKLYNCILLTIAILLWFQGNFLLWDYGVFDGTLINWSEYKWQGWLDLSIWVLLIMLVITFHQRISIISSFISIGFIIIQSFLLITASVCINQNFWLREQNASFKVPEGLTSYSANFNIIHIVLDHFQTDVFLEIVDEESLHDKFDGFILYKENIANAPLTTLSVPTMFSGEIYDGSQGINEYYEESFSKKGINNLLFDKGYNVNLVPPFQIPETKYTNYYNVPDIYGGTVQQERFFCAMRLLEIAIFRQVPHYIKYYIYNNNNWHLTRIFSISSTKKIVSDLNFFQNYILNLKIDNDNPSYHFLHLYAPHPPYVLDEHGKFRDDLNQNRKNYQNQAKYTLNLFIEFLKKLEIMEMYDSSLIILSSDHGSEFPPIINGIEKDIGIVRVPALLAIKPPESRGNIKISNAQTMISDIPATIMDVLGLKNIFEGSSVLSITPDIIRDRIFIVRNQKEGNIVQYIVRGSIFNPDSWMKKNEISIKRTKIYRYEWGEPINFGVLGNAEKYQEKGWSIPENNYEWNNGHEASIIFQADKPVGDIELVATFIPFLDEDKLKEQRVFIKMNEQEVGKWLINDAGYQQKSLLIPKELINSSIINLTFEFPDAVSPKELNITNDPRIASIAMVSITLNQIYSQDQYLRNLFAKTEDNLVFNIQNVKLDEGTVKFSGNGYVAINDQHSKYSNYLEIGLTFKINEYQKINNWLFKKAGEGWPVDVSYTFGFQPESIHFLISEDGKDINGIWLPGDYFEEGITYDLRVVFDNGLLKLYINNELVESKELSIKRIFNSSLPIIIGENFSGNISNFYISYESIN